jgi:leucyl-tRNA synthetase
VNFEEPFQKLRSQGSILGPDHQKMSKSKGNVINPDDVIAEFGADTLRTYEMFMAPFELEKPWDTKGITGVRRFLEKLWRLQERIGAEQEAEHIPVNQAVKKVSADIADCKFNTCVSTLMEAVNALGELPSFSQASFLKVVTLVSPFAPHITEELWAECGQTGFCSLAPWPSYDETKLESSTWECPVQINGKVKAKVVLKRDLNQEEIQVAVEADDKVKTQLQGKEIVKVIIVPGRLVSYVIK